MVIEGKSLTKNEGCLARPERRGRWVTFGDALWKLCLWGTYLESKSSRAAAELREKKL